MSDVQRGAFNIHFETLGPDDGAPLVLIAGLGEQIGSVEFPEEQCALFVERGFRVIRVDNRDAGLSVPSPELDPPDIDGIRGGTAAPPYTYIDMAGDVIAVLDALGIERAHVLGASLGGAIVRWAAIEHRARVASLTVIMSGAGAAPGEDGPQNDLPALMRLFGMAERRSRGEAVASMVEFWRWMWGEGYPFDEDWLRERVTHAFDRSYRPDGIARQFVAGIGPPGLWRRQSEIGCPTLVMHGGLDPLWGPEHAEATASQIPGAELWIDPRQGHTMHREQWIELARRVATLAG